MLLRQALNFSFAPNCLPTVLLSSPGGKEIYCWLELAFYQSVAFSSCLFLSSSFPISLFPTVISEGYRPMLVQKETISSVGHHSIANGEQSIYPSYFVVGPTDCSIPYLRSPCSCSILGTGWVVNKLLQLLYLDLRRNCRLNEVHSVSSW